MFLESPLVSRREPSYNELVKTQTQRGWTTMKKANVMGIGLAAGAVVGAAASLLLAPKKGTELRQDVKQTAKRVKGKAEYVAKRFQANKPEPAAPVAVKEEVAAPEA